jgi:hypothetical protein
LTSIIKEDSPKPEFLKIKQLAWRIAIVGWNIYFKSTDQQFEMFNLLLKDSFDRKSDLVQASDDILNEQPGKNNFYFKLLKQDGLTPMHMFYIRFYHYSPNFFPLEII